MVEKTVLKQRQKILKFQEVFIFEENCGKNGVREMRGWVKFSC